MTYRGRVKNGVVVLDGQVKLPEGTEVTVNTPPADGHSAADETIPTLYERLEPLIGVAEGLPPDLAQNHDHYLHGRPKE